MSKIFLTIFILALAITSALGQLQYPKQSVAAGATVGFGRYNKNFQNTRAFGFKADWQYNLAPWFSLRTEIGYNRNAMLTLSADGGWTVYDSIQFNFQPSVLFGGISPLLYSRGKYFNFFAGACVGFGYVTMNSSENRFTSDPMNNINESYIENPSFNNYAFGLNPIIGFDIPLGKKRIPFGEIEIAASMNRWLKPFFNDVGSFRPIDYRYFHIQLAYRYNFK